MNIVMENQEPANQPLKPSTGTPVPIPTAAAAPAPVPTTPIQTTTSPVPTAAPAQTPASTSTPAPATTPAPAAPSPFLFNPSAKPAVTPTTAPASAPAPAGTAPTRPLNSVFSAPSASSATPATPAKPSAASVSQTPSKPEAKPKGNVKWIIIGVVVFLIAGTAAWLYFTGFFNPAGQNADQLNGAAPQEQSQESSTQNTGLTQDLSQTQITAQTQSQSQISTQAALNSCPQGQTNDPTANSCVCDINNNYFPLTLAGAYAQPSAGSPPLACTTCSALSDEIIKLGQSQDPADATRKDALQTLSTQNNCSPCAVYDDKISAAYQSKTWDQYFDLIVQKSADATCGRAMPTCDSLKWQLLFLNGLRDKAGKDKQTTPDMLLALKQKQQSLEEDLGNNAACYNLQTVCGDLKTVFETAAKTTSTSQKPSVATPVISAPLLGQNPLLPQAQTQQTQQSPSQQSAAEAMLGETSIPDLGTVTAPQLFDKDFYLLHCPVGNLQTQQAAAPSTQQQSGSGKVSRTKKTATTQQTP